MKISSYGGVIAAADKGSAFPLHKIGDTTAVKRIVMNFQQAGIFPIVIVAGAEENEVRYQLSSNGVVFLNSQQTRRLEMFDSVKAGFSFVQDLCDKIVFTPVNSPMFSPTTLRSLMSSEGDIISPSYNGSSGHPIIVSDQVIPEILAYQGDLGLRGAVGTMDNRVWVDVKDDGILYTVHDGEVPGDHMSRQSKEMLHLAARLSLKKDKVIFDSRTKLLLLLIWKNHSVRAACQQMALSYSKAWEMLNMLEESLGIKLIIRRHGGSQGGKTTLTEQGYLFLIEYQRMEEDLLTYTQSKSDAFKAVLGV
ncbi:MAG TPA: NTP transferase domain-containing protein [Candidatus Pelethocola excrementipullorum]|nr:NTP transferase domain-containing protein [Candidatus Pelethocola excrementipullorum]